MDSEDSNKRLKASRQVKDELDICEAVVRYPVTQGYIQKPVFLSIESRDPSDTFMSRLADLPTPIRKASQGNLLNLDRCSTSTGLFEFHRSRQNPRGESLLSLRRPWTLGPIAWLGEMARGVLGFEISGGHAVF